MKIYTLLVEEVLESSFIEARPFATLIAAQEYAVDRYGAADSAEWERDEIDEEYEIERGITARWEMDSLGAYGYTIEESELR